MRGIIPARAREQASASERACVEYQYNTRSPGQRPSSASKPVHGASVVAHFGNRDRVRVHLHLVWILGLAFGEFSP